MPIDPALQSSVSALPGALIGGGASLSAAVYTQRHQDRLQRIACEIARRVTGYADLIMYASNLLLNACVHDGITLNPDVQRVIRLINRMTLFAPRHVVAGAEAVLKAIIEASLKPSVDIRQLANQALSDVPLPDPLLKSSLVWRVATAQFPVVARSRATKQSRSRRRSNGPSVARWRLLHRCASRNDGEAACRRLSYLRVLHG